MIRILLFLLCLNTPSLAQTLNGRVVGVNDGDTLTLLVARQSYKIRLAQIDAPERGSRLASARASRWPNWSLVRKSASRSKLKTAINGWSARSDAMAAISTCSKCSVAWPGSMCSMRMMPGCWQQNSRHVRQVAVYGRSPIRSHRGNGAASRKKTTTGIGCSVCFWISKSHALPLQLPCAAATS